MANAFPAGAEGQAPEAVGKHFLGTDKQRGDPWPVYPRELGKSFDGRAVNPWSILVRLHTLPRLGEVATPLRLFRARWLQAEIAEFDPDPEHVARDKRTRKSPVESAIGALAWRGCAGCPNHGWSFLLAHGLDSI